MFTDGIVCSCVPSERDFHGLLAGLFDEFNAFQPEARVFKLRYWFTFKGIPTKLFASNSAKNFVDKNKRET